MTAPEINHRVEALGVTVTVTRSAGADGAVVVFIDTAFEPDGSDGGPGLRVLVNDQNVEDDDTPTWSIPYRHKGDA